MKRQPFDGFVEVGMGPQGKQGFWIDSSLIRTKTNRIGLNIGTSSAVYTDDNGVNVRVGSGLEVTTGSPVAVRAAPTPIPQEISALRVKLAATQQALVTARAEVASLAATPANFDTAGLARKAEDPGDVTVDTGDVAAALVLLQDKINALMAAQRAAAQIGSR